MTMEFVGWTADLLSKIYKISKTRLSIYASITIQLFKEKITTNAPEYPPSYNMHVSVSGQNQRRLNINTIPLTLILETANCTSDSYVGEWLKKVSA